MNCGCCSATITPLLRQGLRKILEDRVATFVSSPKPATDATPFAPEAISNPDVAVLDIRMPLLNGIKRPGKSSAARAGGAHLILSMR